VAQLLQNTPKFRDPVTLLRGIDACAPVLKEKLEGGSYDVFHFSGHGYHHSTDPDKSGIILWKDRKSRQLVGVSALELKNWLEKSRVRFAYLSCCEGAAHSGPARGGYFGGLADALATGGIPTVIGFRWPLFDNYGFRFASSFYEEWLKNGGIARAVHAARYSTKIEYLRRNYCWAASVALVQDYGQAQP
jgi:CHAT domain-containing protein